MQKPYTLIIPSWFPTADQPINGVFIEKHVEAISTFRNVVVMYVAGEKNKCKEENVISPSYLRYKHLYANSPSRAFNQIKYIWAQFKAYRYLTRKFGKPELIHLHVVFPAGIFVYLLLLFDRIPLIITEHWTGYLAEDGRYARQSAIIKKITRTLFSKARKCSVVSEYFMDILSDWKLIDRRRLSIVYNILAIPTEDVVKKEENDLKGLYVGSLNDTHKNISVLINAVEIVSHKYPSFTMTLVGGGDETEHFMQMASAKGLLNTVIFFKGFVPNNQLTEIYRAHGFFILTSNFETFNIAAAEAMLSGLPVVSTRCGGPTEFVNEKTGIWIDHTNADETANAIIKLIENRSAFDARSIALQTREKFSYNKILEQLKELYRD